MFYTVFSHSLIYLNNWAVVEDGAITSSLPRTHSGQRNWWGCYLPVARPCPKYHTQCHEIHVRPWKPSPCICLLTVSPVGDIAVKGTTDGGQNSISNPTHQGPSIWDPPRQIWLRSSSDFHHRAGHCAILMSIEAVLGLVGTKTPEDLGWVRAMCECASNMY